MSDQNTTDVDPGTAESMANAAQNANFPATSGDADPDSVVADVEPGSAATDDPTGDSTVDQVVAYLTADVDDAERARRADIVEQVENDRPGENRKGVTAALDEARSPSA